MAKQSFEFQVDQHIYRATALSALPAFHVNRRLLPIMVGILPVIMQDVAAGAHLSVSRLQTLGPDILSRIAESFSQLSDADADYIISTCLTSVQRQDGKGWMKIWNASSKTLQYEDIDDMRVMLAIVVKVLEPLITDFMAGLPSTPPDGEAPGEPSIESN